MIATRQTSKVETDVGRLIAETRDLPTPPIVFSQIQRVLGDPRTSAYDIAAILQEDPGMSARVLKLTNSAYYGLTRAIESVKQAVVIIGMEAIRNLVLSAAMLDAFAKQRISAEFQDSFWRHSLATALAARCIVLAFRDRQVSDPEAGFSAGMLHDIGKMVIAISLPEQAGRIGQVKAETTLIPEHAIERSILGFDHALAGAVLGNHWKLSDKLVEAIRFHHNPLASEPDDSNLPWLIHVSDYVVRMTFDYDPESNTYIEPLHVDAFEMIGCREADLPRLSDRLREEFLKAKTFMEMAKGLN